MQAAWRALVVPPIPFGDFVTDAVEVARLAGDPPPAIVDPVDARGNRYEGRFTLLHRDDATRTATYSMQR